MKGLDRLADLFDRIVLAWHDGLMWRIEPEWQAEIVSECPELFEDESGSS